MDGSFHSVDSDQLSFEIVPGRHSSMLIQRPPGHAGAHHGRGGGHSRRIYGRRDLRFEQAARTGGRHGFQGRSPCHQGQGAPGRTVRLCDGAQNPHPPEGPVPPWNSVITNPVPENLAKEVLEKGLEKSIIRKN
jgi:hypothetical protein